jgi:hypothetical protein
MKNKYIFASILLCSLLLFGCLGPTDNGTQTQNQQQSGTQTQTQNQTGTGNGQQGTGAGTQDVFDAAAVATYTAAMAAGVPLECTILVEGVTQKIYIKGENMLMSTTSAGAATNVISKNDNIYMELDSETKATYVQMGLTCDWLIMEGGEGQSGGMQTGSESVDVSGYTDSNVAWTCSPAMFGDEKFATPGATCTFEEIMGGMGLPAN